MKAWTLAAAVAVTLIYGLVDMQGGHLRAHTALAQTERLVLHERIAAEWQSLDLTARTLANGPIPAAWDAGLFLNIEALNKLSEQIVGSSLQYTSTGLLSGTRIEVAGLNLNPRFGALDAEIELVATKSGLSLPLTVGATVTFQGIATTGADNIPAVVLRIAPNELAPHLGALDRVTRGFWEALVPNLAILLADSHLFEVPVPVPEHIDISLGLETRDTVLVNGGNGSVSYAATMPRATISQNVSYIGPVFTNKGLWLRASLDDAKMQPLAPADTTGLTTNQLKERVAALETALASQLAAAPVAAGLAQLHIGKSMLLAVGDKLKGLDGEKRRIDLVTTGESGSLAGKRQSLGILGNLGVEASLIDNSGTGQIQFSFGQSAWSEKGFALPITINMNAKASIQLNIDVIASGLVRTSVGMLGDGSVSMTPTAKPIIVSAGGQSLAVLQFSGTCAQVRAAIRTDGILKTDFGWTKVPSIGGRIGGAIGPIPPVLILDSRPQFLRLPSRTFGAWQASPRYPAIMLTLAPVSLQTSFAGIELAVAVSSEPVDVLQDSVTRDADLNAAEERGRAKAAEVRSAADAKLQELGHAETCPQSSEFALLLGDLEFGPNNELVRLLVFIGKLTDDAWKEAQRLGGEASPEKIKGWIDNPGDSLHRSEIGRQADHIAHEASPEKAKEWADNPINSAKRSTPGQIITNPGHALKCITGC